MTLLQEYNIYFISSVCGMQSGSLLCNHNYFNSICFKGCPCLQIDFIPFITSILMLCHIFNFLHHQRSPIIAVKCYPIPTLKIAVALIFVISQDFPMTSYCTPPKPPPLYLRSFRLSFDHFRFATILTYSFGLASNLAWIHHSEVHFSI